MIWVLSEEGDLVSKFVWLCKHMFTAKNMMSIRSVKKVILILNLFGDNLCISTCIQEGGCY